MSAPAPTQNQRALAAFADQCEETGIKPAHYYRLTPQIEEARAVIKRHDAQALADLRDKLREEIASSGDC